MMILNSASVQLIRANATRLASCISSKDDLTEFSAAINFEEVFGAIESILTNTDMFFDDELISQLDEGNWKSFRATLLVYTFNIVNRMQASSKSSDRVQKDYRPGAHV